MSDVLLGLVLSPYTGQLRQASSVQATGLLVPYFSAKVEENSGKYSDEVGFPDETTIIQSSICVAHGLGGTQ